MHHVLQDIVLNESLLESSRQDPRLLEVGKSSAFISSSSLSIGQPIGAGLKSANQNTTNSDQAREIYCQQLDIVEITVEVATKQERSIVSN
ncbi:MAG: hypothetical protein WBX01_12205 [Nitrososphaeraceae archaeon]